jgi:hypothetical protein
MCPEKTIVPRENDISRPETTTIVTHDHPIIAPFQANQKNILSNMDVGTLGYEG